MGGIEDIFERRSDAQIQHEEAERTLAESRRTRRASLTEHARALEDVVDEYTAAVRDGSTQAFFERVAADRVERARLATSEKEGQDFSARFVFAARRIHEGLGEFLKATSR